jgi:pimeloyl-ACP methyl ester carboxylesterase
MNLIADAGHWVAYEAAEAFNKKLLEVLRAPDVKEG